MSEEDDWLSGDEPEDAAPEPERQALRVIGRAAAWQDGLMRSPRGIVKATSANVALILQKSEEWAGLRYDEFRGEPVCLEVPQVLIDQPKAGPLDDYLLMSISSWLASRWRLDVADSKIPWATMVAAKARGRAFHPVRDYLRGLTWDGAPRIDSWLTDFAGVERTDYTSTIGRMWLIAAVARVMQPGSLVKTMIILEGSQDAGKSTLLRRLCPNPEWFSDTPIDLGTGKDQFQSLRGKWIVEIPELDGFRGKDAHRIKSFVSSPVDNYRKSYGRTNEDVPRQCVFAGTTNEEHYFQDSTGNVRFWPVKVGRRVNFEEVEKARDQLWAEAFAEYSDGKIWHLTDDRVVSLAHREQAEREEEDVWMAPIRTWLDSPIGRVECGKGVSVAAVMTGALSVPSKDQTRSNQTRVGMLMKKIGFERVAGSDRPRLYKLGE